MSIVGPDFPPPVSPIATPTGGGDDRPAYRAYEGGVRKRTDDDFSPSALGINAINARYLPMLRRRCRWLMRNNPHCRHARDVRVRRTIGPNGVWGEPDFGKDFTDLNNKVRDFFDPLLEGVDPGRQMSLAESQSLYLSEICTVGEVGVYRPIVDAWRGFARGPAVELFAAERIDLNYVAGMDTARDRRATQGARIRQGVEFEGSRVVAYHVTKENPDDGGYFGGGFGGMVVPSDYQRLSAMDAVLAFKREEADQIHGTPWGAAAVETVRLLSKFEEAALLSATAQSSMMGIGEGIRPPFSKDSKTNASAVDAWGNPVVRIEPGQFAFIPPGAKLTLTTPPNMGQSLPPVDEVLLRHLAAAFDLDYASLSQDRTKSTFSSDRHGLIDSRMADRIWRMLVWNNHTKLWRFDCLYWGIATGKIRLTPKERAYINADPRVLHYCNVTDALDEWVDPRNEATANETDYRVGRKNLADMVPNWRGKMTQRAEEIAFAMELEEQKGLPPGALLPMADAAAKAAPTTDGAGKPDTTDTTDTADTADGSDGDGNEESAALRNGIVRHEGGRLNGRIGV